MRRLVVLGSLLALLLGACTGGGDDEPSAKRTTSPTAPVVDRIAKLPAVDLDDLADPRPAKGFTAADTTPYADRLKRLVRSSVLDERWWKADPRPRHEREVRRAAAAGDPGAVPGVGSASATATSRPRSTSCRSSTPRPGRCGSRASSRPPGGPNEAPVPTGSAFQRVALQVFVLYETGPTGEPLEDRERPAPVLVQRWIQLSGSQPGAKGSWPSLANYSVVRGIDPCTLYEDGRYEARDGGQADARSFREFLEAARTKGWSDFGLSDPEDDKPQEKQKSACADRSTS
ncbi:MAG: hypothetical protein PGN07_06980 [Aeromicrobium erythreum]